MRFAVHKKTTKGAQSLDIATQPGQAIGCDISRGEVTGKEIDAFISKRHRDRVATEGDRQAEESWKESVRRYEARCKEANRLAVALRARAEEYDQRAQTLMEDEPKGAA